MSHRSLLLGLLVVALPLTASAGGTSQGQLQPERAKALLQRFAQDFCATEATVLEAQGGWRGIGGSQPGAALLAGASAIGGKVELGGLQGEAAVAAAGTALAAAGDLGHGAGAGLGMVGVMRFRLEGQEFPADAAQAAAMIDQVLGSSSRAGIEPVLKQRPRARAFVARFSAEVKGVRIQRTCFVSEFKGVLSVGVSGGAGRSISHVVEY